MDNIPQPTRPANPGLYTLDEAKKLLILQQDAEITERENALIDLRSENFSMLHEDEPAASWIKYVPIVTVILEVAIIIILFVVKKWNQKKNYKLCITTRMIWKN